jgi:hypothetical protein
MAISAATVQNAAAAAVADEEMRKTECMEETP